MTGNIQDDLNELCLLGKASLDNVFDHLANWSPATVWRSIWTVIRTCSVQRVSRFSWSR